MQTTENFLKHAAQVLHLLLEPVDFTRLETIGSGTGMLARRNEDGRLQEMSDSMMDI